MDYLVKGHHKGLLYHKVPQYCNFLHPFMIVSFIIVLMPEMFSCLDNAKCNCGCRGTLKQK